MGCGSSQKQAFLPMRKTTVTGVLKITVVDAVIDHMTSTFFKMDPFVRVKFSNQNHRTKTCANGGKQPKFNQSCIFYVNSCYKFHGRNLQVQLWDQSKTGDSLVGYGIIDLDPIINLKQMRSQVRCFVNHQRQNAGFVSFVAEFKEERAETLNFRFETASIRRKTRTFGDMNCHVQVIAGQEVLKTQSCKDTQQAPPVWTTEILRVDVPVVLKNLKIIVWDEDKVIGDLQMQVPQLISKQTQQDWNIEFDFQDNGAVAGSLKFQTICGMNPMFSEVKTVHKKPKKVKEEKKEEEKKQEDKKDEKKEEKKEKKKEEKKEQHQADKAQDKKSEKKDETKKQ